MPDLADVQPRKVHSTATADGTLLLLLGLNLLLLAFFIMLNSLSTHGARHAKEVLAKMQQGYGQGQGGRGLFPGDGGDAKRPMVMWKQSVSNQVQGVVLNRLNLTTLPLDADANRVEALLPVETVFKGNAVADPMLVKNMASAAGAESKVTWVIEGSITDQPKVAARAAALGAVAGHVQIRPAPSDVVRVIIIPGQTTTSGVGRSLQDLGEKAGGTVQGVHVEH